MYGINLKIKKQNIMKTKVKIKTIYLLIILSVKLKTKKLTYKKNKCHGKFSEKKNQKRSQLSKKVV